MNVFMVLIAVAAQPIEQGVDPHHASEVEIQQNLLESEAQAESSSLSKEQAPIAEEKNPYELLPISVTERQKINKLITTMAENNVFKLLFEKKQLEKLGREINHLHPIRFLGTIFSDPRLVSCMYEIRRSAFKWDGFLDGFSKRFFEEVKAGNVNKFVPGFAESLNVRPRDIMAYINYKDFEGLLLYLMEKSRQK